MSYRAGAYGMERIGIASGAPTISCDGPGCAVKFEVKGRGMGSVPPAWFLDGKAAPKWSRRNQPDGTRKDFCPACRIGAATAGKEKTAP